MPDRCIFLFSNKDNIQKMSIKKFLFICCAAMMASAANAEDPEKPEAPETSNHPTHQLMDQRVSELMADRVSFKKDLVLKEPTSG